MLGHEVNVTLRRPVVQMASEGCNLGPRLALPFVPRDRSTGQMRSERSPYHFHARRCCDHSSCRFAREIRSVPRAQDGHSQPSSAVRRSSSTKPRPSVTGAASAGTLRGPLHGHSDRTGRDTRHDVRLPAERSQPQEEAGVRATVVEAPSADNQRLQEKARSVIGAPACLLAAGANA